MFADHRFGSERLLSAAALCDAGLAALMERLGSEGKVIGPCAWTELASGVLMVQGRPVRASGVDGLMALVMALEEAGRTVGQCQSSRGEPYIGSAESRRFPRGNHTTLRSCGTRGGAPRGPMGTR